MPETGTLQVSLNRLIQNIDQSVVGHASSGRPRTVRNDETIEQVGELVRSQEEQPQTHLTVRQIHVQLVSIFHLFILW